jgi:hypothetical protein
VFVVRRDGGTGARVIAATTRPDPTVGLVFYDLKSALRDSAESTTEQPKKTKRAPKKAADEA